MLGDLARVISQSSALSSLFVFHNVFLFYPPIFSYHAKDTSLIYLFPGCFPSRNGVSERGYPGEMLSPALLGQAHQLSSLPAGMRVGTLHPEARPSSLHGSERGWLPPMRSQRSLLPLLPHGHVEMWVKHSNGPRCRNNILGLRLPSPKPNQSLVGRLPLLVGSPPGPAAPWLCNGSGLASPHPGCLPLGAHINTDSPVQKGPKHHSAFPGYPPT